MSLFENAEYQWRETFFVFLDGSNRPRADDLESALQQLSRRFLITDVRADANGYFESLTIESPDDSAAMDISCVVGEEVEEQIPSLVEEVRTNAETADEKKMLERLPNCSARLDVFHFEHHSGTFIDEESDEEFMDPGGLLTVLDCLGELCNGVVIDPQTGALL